MAKITLILTLFTIGGGLVYTMFKPILLPPEMVVFVKEVLITLYAFDGILPITAIINVLAFWLSLMFLWLAYKLVMSLLGSSSQLDN